MHWTTLRGQKIVHGGDAYFCYSDCNETYKRGLQKLLDSWGISVTGSANTPGKQAAGAENQPYKSKKR